MKYNNILIIHIISLLVGCGSVTDQTCPIVKTDTPIEWNYYKEYSKQWTAESFMNFWYTNFTSIPDNYIGEMEARNTLKVFSYKKGDDEDFALLAQTFLNCKLGNSEGKLIVVLNDGRFIVDKQIVPSCNYEPVTRVIIKDNF